MTQLNSKIIICNGIKLDKTYKNVIDYTHTDMVTLCETNKIAKSEHYSFIKHGVNKISVDFTYSDCLRANYMAFQNYDYSNRWFFAFIDSVEFSSPGSTIINFTVDVFSTWFNDITVNRCFVVREHVNDDTIGLHTIPEGLEIGEYKSQGVDVDSVNNDLTVILGTSEDYDDNYKIKVNEYNGIPAPLTYYRFDVLASLQGTLQGLQQRGKADAIVSMFLAPKWLAPYVTGSTDNNVATSSQYAYEDIGINRISALDGYSPKNNKMLCFPFCYIGMSNSIGQYQIYHQENWAINQLDSKLHAGMYGALVNGCSIRVVPQYYLGNQYAYDYSIVLGKFPSLAWANDVYTNWLTQNGVNILGITLNAEQAGVVGSLARIGAGIALASTGGVAGVTAGGGLIGSGARGMFDTMQQSYQADIIPAGIRGSINSGDVTTSMGANRLYVYYVTIKQEYAKICDEFLTKFGYKVTTLKLPNVTGRKYWNYVQIGASEMIGFGNIPADAMRELNNIFINGVTIWHDHANIGNYILNNTIVS